MDWWNLIPNSPCRIDSGQCRFRITSYANFTAFEQRLKIFSISSSLLALSLDKPVLDRSRTGWRDWCGNYFARFSTNCDGDPPTVGAGFVTSNSSPEIRFC